MADEPDEAGDSGSDATGASSSSDSAGSTDADDGTSSPAGSGDATAADDGTPSPADADEGGDAADADEGSDADDTDEESDVDDADEGSDVDDAADDDAEPTDDGRSDDESADSDDEDGDVSDLAPVGADAPSPDEGESAAASSSEDATATVTDADESAGSSILSGGIGGSAPPDDEEMPLTEHIEEMLTRLAIVVVIAAVATLVAFPFANDLIINMWYDVHSGSVEACKTAPQSDGCVAPHVYGPLELVLTRIRVAGLAGLLVALPLGIYQTYRFMRPGLYPHERRYFLASVPFSLVLGIVGMVFAYFVILPLLFAYFIGYTEGSADLAFQLAETMNLILLMMGMLAIVFQIPLLILLAIMMGITTRRWLESRRLYFWGLFLGVAVIFGPDPTGMAPFLLTATMVALFEGTLLLLRWTGR